MIELDVDHRASDVVVEDRVLPGGTDPGKVGFVEMGLHFGEADLGVPLILVVDIDRDEIEETTLRRTRSRGCRRWPR